jgi:HJR/Mrr/RecB family endonuclease
MNPILRILLIILVILIVIGTAAYFIKRKYLKHWKKINTIGVNTTIDEIIEKLSPTEFEHYVAKLYREKGFRAKVTPPVNDGGKDIIMWKNGKKYVVEAKRYNRDKKVTRPEMQKFESAARYEKAKGIFVTTSTYTPQAKEYAKDCNIEIINGYKLTQMINEIYNRENNYNPIKSFIKK